jgi:23S rRNA U2552 (ribose-2'-O)-methylase RlmE/FtsJ
MLINKNIPINLNIEISYIVGSYDNDKRVLFKKFDNQIKKCKSQIDELDNINDWDKAKKYLNPFELIHITSNNQRKNSVAHYNPISRSYFKMIEMINKFNLCNMDDPMVVSNLAEGPGGFMEAILYYRNNYDDVIKGITLKSKKNSVPSWNKFSNLIKKYKNIQTYYGNLYNLKTIMNYANTFEDRGVDLVTGDAGFDYSCDFNSQEVISHRIIFSEILAALIIQKVGGSFICKIFDTFHILTLKLIYILYCLYDEVNLYKPATSRKANSEKYIVCKGFRGIDENLLANLCKIHTEWHELSLDNKTILDIDNIKLPNEFVRYMFEYNSNFINNQMKYINNTIELTKSFDRNIIHELICKQTNNAIEWCKQNNLELNYKSKYLYYYNINNNTDVKVI